MRAAPGVSDVLYCRPAHPRLCLWRPDRDVSLDRAIAGAATPCCGIRDHREGEGRAAARVTPESPEPTSEEEALSGASTIHGANFALVLGILAALRFMVSPLALMLPAAGIFYGGRALYEGIRYFQVVLIRALIVVVLSAGSIGLHYLNLTGQLLDLTQLMTG